MANGWNWPAATDGVVFDGTYVGAHPTRYDQVWQPNVEQMARMVVDYYYQQNGNAWGTCWANTYVDHPPGWGRDATSIDFWGYDRTYPIDFAIGQEICNWLFNVDPGQPPFIEWMIWQGWWWRDGIGWAPYQDFDLASDAQHVHHLHVTYYP